MRLIRADDTILALAAGRSIPVAWLNPVEERRAMARVELHSRLVTSEPTRIELRALAERCQIIIQEDRIW